MKQASFFAPFPYIVCAFYFMLLVALFYDFLKEDSCCYVDVTFYT